MPDSVAWNVVERSWPMVAAGGEEAGGVNEMIGDVGADIFDGPSVAQDLPRRPRDVPSEPVGEIVARTVRPTVDRSALDRLDER